MGSSERTTEKAYNDLKYVILALRNIIKFLNGKDAVKVRLLDSYWNPVVIDTLRHEERVGMTGVKVNLVKQERLDPFLAQFPQAITSMGLHQFSNFHIFPQAPTTANSCLQFGTIHGPWLRFVTIHVPATWNLNFDVVKLFLNQCPAIEKLTFQGTFSEAAFEAANDLGVLPNLVELEIHRIWTPQFDQFLKEILTKAPKLRWISITIDMWDHWNPQTLDAYLRPSQHLMLVDLDVRYASSAVFRELPEMDIKVARNLSVEHVGGDVTLGNGEVVAFNDWLGRQVTLQSLTFRRDIWWEGSFTLPFRFPPVTSIRKLDLEYSMESPIRSTQVPNLETVTLFCLPMGNPFDPETEFPQVKCLTLWLHSTHPGGWNFQFPNLMTLNVAVLAGTLEILRGYLGQFPNIVKLILEFGANNLNQRDTYWDYFTGGIRPIMDRGTGVEDLQTRIPPIGEQEILPLQLVPGLKSLELRSTPEIVAFAVINLTAVGRIRNLELRMTLDKDASANEVNNFIEILQQHHSEVWISRYVVPLPLET